MQKPSNIRYARKDELTAMVQLSITAFRHSGRQVNAALFPERLRINPGDTDEIELSVRNMVRTFDYKNRHYVVAVDDQDTIMGWAEWTSREDPVEELTPEEREKKRAEGVSRLPASFDLQAAQQLGREAEELSKKLREALGEEGYQNSWRLRRRTRPCTSCQARRAPSCIARWDSKKSDPARYWAVLSMRSSRGPSKVIYSQNRPLSLEAGGGWGKALGLQ
ncbi:hypothetical protein FJTKL_02298 [Diaporthe vaccinii]|uniref:Uncharacterized protein n=1 Tax=Diaporthe vaccinii TaxID=105482 RepID=A0ABR4F446_9PEZI